MLEAFVVLAVALFIAILFYKQANESFQILQIDAERVRELPTLYVDRSPIVVRGMTLPPLGTEEELRKRPAILQALVAPAIPLSAVLRNRQTLESFRFSPMTATFLSKESGLQTWFHHHLFQTLLPSPYTTWVYSSRTGLWPGGRGLFKTSAFQTLVMPTQGTAIVTLLLQSMVPYLPTRWEGRRIASIGPQDTPLLSQLKSTEIRVRTGTFVIIPPHIIVDIRSDGELPMSPISPMSPMWAFIAEVHHPISLLGA